MRHKERRSTPEKNNKNSNANYILPQPTPFRQVQSSVCSLPIKPFQISLKIERVICPPARLFSVGLGDTPKSLYLSIFYSYKNDRIRNIVYKHTKKQAYTNTKRCDTFTLTLYYNQSILYFDYYTVMLL